MSLTSSYGAFSLPSRMYRVYPALTAVMSNVFSLAPCAPSSLLVLRLLSEESASGSGDEGGDEAEEGHPLSPGARNPSTVPSPRGLTLSIPQGLGGTCVCFVCTFCWEGEARMS